MKQALLKKGTVVREYVPQPGLNDRDVLVRTMSSCISAGTEMSGVQSSGQSLVRRALQHPDQVMQIFQSLRQSGVQKTISRVRGRIDASMALGYSAAGIVDQVGTDSGFTPGQRVAVAGVGFANHAEMVRVPTNLVTPIPEGVSFQHASTVALGSIAMQGVRRAGLSLGERCVVVGAGIVGLLAIQLLRTAGVRVAVVDLNVERLEIARSIGAEFAFDPRAGDPVEAVINWSGGSGVDAVVFAAATSSSEPLSQSFQMCRRKGRVVLVGVSGMNIDRADIYEKELDFLISTSYGPGRYDRNYEERGLDYPVAYVRWTEGRNMSEYLRLIGTGTVDLVPLVQGEYDIDEVTEAYESLSDETTRPLIVVLNYPQREVEPPRVEVTARKRPVGQSSGRLGLALVGAGGFATGVHLPNLVGMNDIYDLRAICTNKGHDALNVARQFGADVATTDLKHVLDDDGVDVVLIATRHDTHSELALGCLRAGKHVVLEKPLATNITELERIDGFCRQGETPVLFVGFNRRFSRCAMEVKRHLDKRVGPVFINYRMNAGLLPEDSWIYDQGGRIVGEGCHIIDLAGFLTGSKVESVAVQAIASGDSRYRAEDNMSITLRYADGSIFALNYFALGNAGVSKEAMEVHFDGNTLIMEDYKSLRGYGVALDYRSSTISDKGQREELLAFHQAVVKGGPWPISLDSMVETTRVALLIADQV